MQKKNNVNSRVKMFWEIRCKKMGEKQVVKYWCQKIVKNWQSGEWGKSWGSENLDVRCLRILKNSSLETQ